MSQTAQVRRYHRIATVRKRQGITLRTVSRNTGIPIQQLKHQEDESRDLQLSVFYRWQKALDVPLAELLGDADDQLSPPILRRAKMVKIMKTVAAILEQSGETATRRLAQNLSQQLVELMPELREIKPWPTVGQRRAADEFGRTAERPMALEISAE